MHSVKTRLYILLRKSESVFKTDMVYLMKGGFWIAVGRIVAIAGGLISALAFANLLSPYLYGQYKYIISFVEFAGALSLTGIGTAVTKAVAQGDHSALMRGVRLAFLGNVISVAVALGGVGYYFLMGASLFAYGLLLAGILIPLINTFSLYQAFLNGTQAFREVSLLGALQTAAATLSAALVLLFTTNILWVIGISSTAHLAVTLVLFLYVKKYLIRPTKTRKSLRAIGSHMSILNSLPIILSRLEHMFLFQLLGPLALSTYIFATAIPNQLTFIQKAVKSLAFPKFAQRPFQELAVSIPRKGLFIGGGMLVIVGSYIAAAPFIYRTFFPAYIDAVFYSQLFSLFFLFGPAALFTEALIAHERIKTLYAPRIASLVIRVAAVIVLVPLYGILGIFFAHLMSRIVANLMVVGIFAREYRKTRRATVPGIHKDT